jgi:hypothetical protein
VQIFWTPTYHISVPAARREEASYCSYIIHRTCLTAVLGPAGLVQPAPLLLLSKNCPKVVKNFVSPGKKPKKVNRPENKNNNNNNKKKKKKKITGIP